MQMREAIPTVRARLQAGEVVDYRDLNQLAARPSNYSSQVLRDWHKAGLTHIVAYVRGRAGLPIPRYAWGPGKDVPRPKPLSRQESWDEWRRRNPEWKIRDNSLQKARRLRRNPPPLDPISAALLGVS